MKEATYEIMGGHKFVVDVPTTVDEYNSLAKRGDDAVVVDAVDHEVYHGTLGDARDGFVALLIESTGIARREIGTGKFTGDGDKKKEVTKKETPGDYYKRVCAEKGVDPNGEPFADVAARISKGGDKVVKMDPSVSRRAAEPKKLPQEYIDLGKQAVDDIPWLQKKYQQEVGKPLVYDTTKTGDDLVIELGWKIREIKLAKNAKEKQAGLKSFLGK